MMHPNARDMTSQPDQPSFIAAGAILTIRLDAIRANYRQLRDRLGGARCAGVVKADAYGLGAVEVSRALREAGCSDFFVAHLTEGLELREALGADVEIYVLNGVPQGAENLAARAGLTAVCNSLGQLHAWRSAARQSAARLPVAVQIDSGMSRLGMSAAEVEAVAADAGAFDGLELRLVMSHLACADEADNPANEFQRRNFETLRRLLPEAPSSLANSSGIFLGEKFRHDLARPGAALYGINPTPGLANPMRQVVRLEAKVIQTRDVAADVGVGYGLTWRGAAARRLATISLGYADGWPRRAAASAHAKGTELPFAGRVSMDSIVLDASALPAGGLKSGDLVELIGSHRDIDELAAAAGTIGYEILTGLGRRFHRRYELD